MSTWYINNIIIDSHEKIRGNNAYNYYIKNYEVKIDPLEYGDYLFHTNDDKKIVFEFKTTKDFIKSMEDKSLFNELSNQSINFEYSYLVICGDFNETFEYLYWNVPQYRYKYKRIDYLKSRLTKQVNGALYRVYSMYIPIIFANDEEMAFEQMLKISSKIADAKKYGGIVRPSRNPLIINPSTFYLTKVNGIGDVKAKNITDELNIQCLDDLCKQKPSDFLSVSKVTEKNVRELWKDIHNEDL
jgi:ERCC4-type nuclease